MAVALSAMWIRGVLVLVTAGLASGLAAAGERVLVLAGSDTRAYREAVDAFASSYGPDVDVVFLSKDPAIAVGGRRTVVAFGGQAAMKAAEARHLVYCMAPGTSLKCREGGRRRARVGLLPPPAEVVSAIRFLQPAVKGIAVLWSSPAFEAEAKNVKEAGERLGISVASTRVRDARGLPEVLRDLAGKVGAVWLMPDPLLVTRGNFTIMKAFSWGNDMPLYVATEGLVAHGATASIGATFAQVGERAAEVARKIERDGAEVGCEHRVRGVVTLGKASAEKAGLRVTAAVLSRIDKVMP